MAQAEIKTKLSADGSELARALQQGISKAADFRTQMRGIGSSIGAAFTVSAITNFAVGLARMGDEIQDAAGALGLSTDEMQAFDALARRTAGGVDGLRAGIKKMAEVQADAREKGGAAAETFDKLGMGADGYTASLADVLKATADYYVRTGDLATVQDLMGKSAVTTREALVDLSKKTLPELIKAMTAAGLVIDDSGVKTLAKFNLMLEEGKIKAASFAVAVVESFAKIKDQTSVQGGAWRAAINQLAPGMGSLLGIKLASGDSVEKPIVSAVPAVVKAMDQLAESFEEVSDGAAQFAVEQLAATESERVANAAREQNADMFKFLMALGDAPGPLAQEQTSRFSDLRRIGANELGRGMPAGPDKAAQMIDLMKKQVSATGKIPDAVRELVQFFGRFT